MENQVTIQKETILEAYKYASKEQRKVLENIFGEDVFFPKDITERIKTFEDAVSLLGYDNQTVIDYYKLNHINSAKDIIAFAKLRVIIDALNEGWKPTFDSEERRYYPWFFIYNNEEYEKLNEEEKKECYVVRRSYAGSYANGGVVYAYASGDASCAVSHFGSRLSLKTSKLAEYCGRQFIDIWTDYLFT